ncbi:MAG: outer membrane beta-barrel protein [Steroidobacteraceae bacterium]
MRAGAIALCLSIAGSAQAADSGFYFGVNVGQSDFDVDRGTVGVAFVPLFLSSPIVPAFSAPSAIYAAPGDFYGLVERPLIPAAGTAAIGASNVELHHVDRNLSATVGYQANSFFAAELSYVDLGTVEMRASFPIYSFSPVVSQSSLRQSTEIGVSGIQLSLLGRYPITPAWSVFGKLGYLFADADVDFSTRIAGSASSSEVAAPKVSSENVALGAGVDFSFASKWIARLEYQRHLEVGGDAFIDEPDVDSVSLGIFLRL